MKRTLLMSLFAFGLPLIGYADEAAAPAAAPVLATARAPRLVGVILSSAQALLWDEDRGEYVIHKVGEDLLGGRLVELDADHIVIDRGEAREVIEISAPPQMRVAGRRQPKRMPAMIIRGAGEATEVAAATPSVPARAVAAPVVADVAPSPPVSAPAFVAQAPSAAIDPTTLPPPPPATPVVTAPSIVQPVAAPVAAPTVQAIPAPAAVSNAPASAPAIVATPPAPSATAPAVATPVVVAPGVATSPVAAPAATPAAPITTPAAAPVVAPAVQSSPVAPAASAPSPVAAPVVPSAPATAPVAASVAPDRKPVTAMQIARAELDRELGDFGALSQNVQVTAQPEGGFRLAQVRAGSFFERIGLRTNDVVVRVDGRAINGVDDASAAYAWLRVTNRFSVELVRDGRPVTLRYVIAPAQPLTAAAQ